MKLHNLRRLDKFLKKHQTAKDAILNWKGFVESSSWENPDDVKEDFPRTRFITQYRLVFKLGNNWRIDVEIDYEHQIAFIRQVGTHEEYNKWKF